MKGVFMKRKLDTDTNTERMVGEEIRDQVHVRTSQVTSKMANKPPETRRGAWTNSPSQPLEGTNHVHTSLSGFLPPEL